MVPLYFMNESNTCFIILILMTYIFSKYILPFFNGLFSIRYFLCFVTKSTN
uniref:ATP synthase protein 8 n=1 Tax=Bacidia sorediata TaxID=1885590 RepID=A0A515MN60_9LECA|nr:ATP synthase subunit 8 [Bacidia sorediata]